MRCPRIGARFALLAALGITGWANSAKATSLSNIQDWVGSGSNSAGMELSWYTDTGEVSMVWGYHWTGTATGEDMLDAVIAADPRLYGEIGTGEYGDTVIGLGYHASGDGNFQLSPSLSFGPGRIISTAYDDAPANAVYQDVSRTTPDAGDQWEEGWFTIGYWSYWSSTDSQLSADGADWDYPENSSGDPEGMGGYALSDGDFNGWAFNSYSGDYPAPADDPMYASPLPEPAALSLIMIGLPCLILRRRRIAAGR